MRIAQLEEMTARCGLPARTLALIGADQVSIQVEPDVEYKKVDCLLSEMKKADPKLSYLFVGNEAYGLENQR